ncbi:striatin-4 isoform X1 [Drosophila biarmipes]|uniref:striatin-4 isoform X1 n=1 Tax=Drosophila biarmipes TaxID=125945 RepID=UPI0007E6A302|nr:striatin-4 isoform X1 [Drosophila biarmipes]XP_016968585.1 striatin-4 isoform X1 [Drosophila biarmipes]XP_016968586.1 striatin-4 isoform X1 [Drosophila biarmipes]XP_016968587.1 striatin-4 isoform X1 [Drosophila biarmipes]XP_016968588.1 striatin-4 isoform X1 [Drosophila biarmipes]XP_043949950.1 striatin-4 isoform X1 [Drosophila biarmipes]XP_043949951.1 striatin-4 isoform X1 [Drosophila biarmipes]XP_050741443.1 striatin-4 isoform X1 [Drosophila biarmipes]XP_050741444.1 striatin-4 isoform X
MGTNSGATAGINNKPVGGAAAAGVLGGGGGVGGANSSIGGVLSNSLGGGGSGGLSISGLNAGGQNANVGGLVGGGGMGNVGGDDGGNGMVGGGPNNQQATTPQYTIPGILHFIQHEWSRFELERSQWDVDRAELQARIAMLLGERKCLESLKSDLTRRIKMLEYALRQERAKFYRLKYGTDPPQLNEFKPSNEDAGLAGEVATDSEVPYSSVSNTTWRQGRQMLRQYLAEIGYTDNIIDVRSNRVRSILGLNNNAEHDGSGGGLGGGLGGGTGGENLSPNINGNESNKRASETEGRHTPAKKVQQSIDEIIVDTEAAVMANFEFLGATEMSDDDEISDDLEMVATDNDDTDVKLAKRSKSGKDMLTEDLEADVGEQLLNDMNLMTEEVDGSLGLGELAQLTVNNESDGAYDANSKDGTGGSAGGAGYRKTWNAKYTLRSHFDGVRSLIFHPEEPVLITASEDHTLKLWNLQKTVQAKKSASLDVEPLYTFRAHTGPVLCLGMSSSGETCYSGGLDGNIECWQLPSPNIDPYDCYDPNVHSGTLEGHTDAVWGLTTMQSNIVSCSADGTVKLWSPYNKEPLLRTYTASEAEGAPSSVDFVRNEVDHIVVAYNSAHCIVYDTETGKQVVRLEAAQEMSGNTGKFINKVVSHPTLPITITAHEDRHIRFWDNTSGTLVHSMVAHLEPVTSLAVDAHGLYLLSGSHDCSIRLWNLDNKTCVQEITAHRKKFDESIFDVAFHATKPYIASAGADGLAKVFV